MENRGISIRDTPTEDVSAGMTRKKRLGCSCSKEECTRCVQELPPPKRHQDYSQVPTDTIYGMSQRFLDLEQQMCQALSSLHFGSPVTHIYNPLDYATEPHCYYVNSYANSPKKLLFFGMNPGPFGMAQTGVGYGHIHGWSYIYCILVGEHSTKC